MSVFHPVILLARERARFRFSLLASRILLDADSSVATQLSLARSVPEQKTIVAARDYLASQTRTFPARLTQKYDAWLERGMQTMYRDLRAVSRAAAMDAQTVMDEALATRQMEIERRVLRLREADQLSLERLNTMIAQLHGETDIRERENPFRPYLMARALYDVLCETTRTTDVCTMLFDHLSGALAARLPEYFSVVLAVFDAQAEPSRLMIADGAADSRGEAESLIDTPAVTDGEAMQRALAVLAMAGAEPREVGGVLPHITNALRERLSGVATDARVRDFIVRTWSRVLTHVAMRKEIDSQPFLAVAPDLLWSVQATGAAERSRLIRLIPTLIKRIRDGLQMIDLPPAETRAVMDVLVELHAQAMRPLQQDNAMPILSMAELHRRFSTLHLSGESLEAPAIAVPSASEEQLRALLKEHGVDAGLYFDDEPAFLRNADARWLDALLPGVTVEFWRSGGFQQAVLLGTDAQRTFYLFSLLVPEGGPRLLVYSTIALIKALREGSVSRTGGGPR